MRKYALAVVLVACLMGAGISSSLPVQVAIANGLTYVGGVIGISAASATASGSVTTGIQSFAGAKTFTGPIAASNLSGTNSGNLTLTAVGSTPSANGASLSTQALTLQPADATHPGLVTTGTQAFAGEKTFASIVTTAASGQVGIQGVTGQKWCLGAGGNECMMSSNGRLALPAAAVTELASYSNSLYLNVNYGTPSVSRGVIEMNYYPGSLPSDRFLLRLTQGSSYVPFFTIDYAGMPRIGIDNVTAPPTCVADLRGTLWYTGGGTGVTDTVSMCLKAVANTYSWVTITTGG
jgi:hypothetical protein